MKVELLSNEGESSTFLRIITQMNQKLAKFTKRKEKTYDNIKSDDEK